MEFSTGREERRGRGGERVGGEVQFKTERVVVVVGGGGITGEDITRGLEKINVDKELA